MNIGLADWIATDVEDYLSRATAFASDWQRLASLRADLRRRALASPIFDAPRFAANFVEALNGMWCAWCSLQEGEHP
jgi:predicted O-linked N-acetylglucosamine transferase (SPINDLY family)